MKHRALIKFALGLLSITLGFSAVSFGAEGGPVILNPKATNRLPPAITENLLLCDNNQLKESVTNPSCQGWQLTSITEAPNTPNEGPFYISNHGDACTVGTDGNLRCFFRFPKLGCKAWTEARNIDPNLASDFKKVCGCGELAKDAQGNTVKDVYNCAWCAKGEQGCSGNGTQFFDQLKCSGNQHTINFLTVPPEAYHSYCDLEVSGPYSEFPDNYTACGTTHTDTYPGMIFTLDQRRQIKEINRSQNMITQTGKFKSDLAGFCYPKPANQPCIKNHPTQSGFCVEPGTGSNDTLLTSWPTNKPESAQVHHVIPKSDTRNLKCPCGRNSMKNAVIISAQLNRYFSNRDRTTFKSDCDSGMTELAKVNSLPKYNPAFMSVSSRQRRPN